MKRTDRLSKPLFGAVKWLTANDYTLNTLGLNGKLICRKYAVDNLGMVQHCTNEEINEHIQANFGQFIYWVKNNIKRK